MTNPLKDAIVDNALVKSGYTAARAAYLKRRSAWGEAIRLDSLGIPESQLKDFEKKLKKLVDQVPTTLRSGTVGLRYDDSLYLTVAGQKDLVHFKAAVAPYRHEIAFDHPLAIEREQLINEEARLDKWRDDVRAPVKAAVNSVTTVAALLKAWPEAKELIPKDVPEAAVQLPAVRVADLNKLIGLPTEGEQP
jgi:hypothetical protein